MWQVAGIFITMLKNLARTVIIRYTRFGWIFEFSVSNLSICLCKVEVRMNQIQKWIPLFLVSALGLFIELAAIRWVEAELFLISSYKNLCLMAAFLGLSIGFGLANSERDYRRFFAPIFSLFIFLVLALSKVNTSPDQPLMHPGAGNTIVHWIVLILVLLLTLTVFLLTTFLFIPLGQATGREMALHVPVPAYVVN